MSARTACSPGVGKRREGREGEGREGGAGDRQVGAFAVAVCTVQALGEFLYFELLLRLPSESCHPAKGRQNLRWTRPEVR